MKRQINQIAVYTFLVMVAVSSCATAEFFDGYEYTDNGDGTCTIIRGSGTGDVTIPDTFDGLKVTAIKNDAYAQCYGLTSLTIPAGIISIGISAFSPTNLTAIIVASTNPAYSSLDGVLFNKTQTELIRCPERRPGDYTIPNSVTTIGNGAFAGSKTLTSIIIPDNVTTIGSNAFRSCYELTSIIVEKVNPAYSSIDGVLFNKTQTELIRCPERKAGNYTIPNSITTIVDFAFDHCQDLTGTLTIPDSVITIGNFAFFYCTGLTDLTIGKNVTAIGNFAFGQCQGLTSISIGNNVTSIGDNGFFSCDSLTCVIIPGSITTIGYRGLAFCNGLTSIFFKGVPPALGTDVFRLTNATAYYLPGATGWGGTFGGLATAEWQLSIADVDTNGDVNIADLAVFAASWQTESWQPEYNPLCDISDPVDGIINVKDLQVLADNWLITPCR